MESRTVYFLTLAEDLEQAKRKIINYIENAGSCRYSLIPKLSGSLAKRHKKLVEVLKKWDWKKEAGDLLIEAEKFKTTIGYFAEDDLLVYGNFLISAGVLYAQKLSVDTCIFNIEYGNYYVPDKEDHEHWWVIAVDIE